MFSQGVLRSRDDFGVAVVTRVVEEIRYYQRNTVRRLERQRTSYQALLLLSRGRWLPADRVRVVADDMQTPTDLRRYRAVNQGHALAFVFHIVPRPSMSVFVDFEYDRAEGGPPENVNPRVFALGWARKLNCDLPLVWHTHLREQRAACFLVPLSPWPSSVHGYDVLLEVHESVTAVVAMRALYMLLFFMH